MTNLEIDASILEMPIPCLSSVEEWKKVPIRECGEPLVELNNFCPDLIVVDPQYYKQGIENASPTLFARRGVAQKLLEAARLLPQGYKLVIWDAWRPLGVQKALFDDYFKKLKAQFPDLPNDKLNQLTQTYVSLPSNDPLKPSPHFTGGAIDLTIMRSGGNLLNMGTLFDHFGPEAALRFYERKHGPQFQEIAANRRLLYWVMNKAGFSPYDEEWWHFDFGIQFDAIRTKKDFAIYGRIDLKGTQ